MSGFNNINQFDQADYSGYFIATVVDNNDPLKQQRVRVTIPKLLVGDIQNLPWIAPIVRSDFGITPTAGTVAVPVNGSKVRVEFQNGDLYYGLYSGSFHYAGYIPNTELTTNYPKRRGWSDPMGNIFWIDNTSGSVEVHFMHKSGATIHINDDGDVTVTNTTSVTVNTVDALVNATATATVTSPVVSVNASTSATVTTPAANIYATTALNITSPQTTITGKLTVTGDVATAGAFTNNGVNVGSTHYHTVVILGSPGNTSTPV